MAEEYRPLKRPGQAQESDTDDTVLAQGIRATVGPLELEDPITGTKTLAELAAGGGGGEINDLVNAGTGISGVATPSKVSLDLQARGHAAASSKIIVGEDVPNKNVTYDVDEASISHQNLNGAGSNTHGQIDAHIADLVNPHAVTAAQLGAATLTPTPADEEMILGDGSATNIRGGGLRLNEIGSSGIAGEPTGIVEDDGGGNVRINAHTAVFKTTATILAPNVRVEVPLISAIAIPLDEVRWVGVDYNSGTPIEVLGTALNQFNLLTQQPLAVVSRDAAGVYVVPVSIPLTAFAARSVARIADTEPIIHDSGLIIDTAGGSDEQFEMTAGALYIVMLLQSYSALDTSVSGSFDVYTGSTGGGFSAPSTLTDYPQDQYNDGTSTPATLTNNRWGNIWWYLDVTSGAVVGFLGTSNTNDLATAGAESLPNDLPPRLQASLLLGRFLILKDTPGSTVPESAFQTSFQGEGVTNHTSLSGLTTGDAGHTQLQTRVEKGAVSGYASLDSNTAVVEPAQVIRTTTGPTNLSVGAIADGELLTRVGGIITSVAGGGGGATTLTLGMRTRTTSVVGVSTTPVFISFDQEDNAIASFFTYSGGEFTAQKTLKAFIYAEGAMSWNSGTEPKVWIDLVKNSVTAIGTNTANVYSSLLQQNSMACVGFADFAVSDTLRMYWYTTAGTVNLVAETPKIVIVPLELS